MKQSLVLALLIAAVALIAIPTAQAAETDTESVTLSVPGMSCSIGCPITIQKTLAKLDGISEVSVDFANKQVTFSLDTSKASADDAVKAIQGVGYSECKKA